MPKKTPLKSDHTIVSIVFPEDGLPYPNVEHLPGEQDKQELAAVKKLLGALARFTGEQYQDPQVGSGTTDDIVCQSEDGRKIEIQVTWTGDDNIRQLREMRDSYVEAIETGHPHVLKAFRGCDVTLVDTGDPPYLPEVSKREGQLCLDELVIGLMDIGSEINTLQVGKVRGRKLCIGPHKREVGIDCERRLSAKDDAPCSIHWEGSLPVYQGKGPKATLSETVQKKIDKKYVKPDADFWLLIYSTDMPLSDNDPDIKRTQEILTNQKHPFDVVWYLYPYSNKDLGHLISIWPLD